ncbi:hypothetical protein EVG20_g10997 [Dentipellis fragilis]|uniref:Uncharacterized protein n=1 Tax=Dentipellis fragilis TaxID=205917 RepID=A0A4Y9XNX5_9AGAM|nr:hypothetical protein EVG20_g10997 [Dentipellis fragilis]
MPTYGHFSWMRAQPWRVRVAVRCHLSRAHAATSRAYVRSPPSLACTPPPATTTSCPHSHLQLDSVLCAALEHVHACPLVFPVLRTLLTPSLMRAPTHRRLSPASSRTPPHCCRALVVPLCTCAIAPPLHCRTVLGLRALAPIRALCALVPPPRCPVPLRRRAAFTGPRCRLPLPLRCRAPSAPRLCSAARLLRRRAAPACPSALSCSLPCRLPSSRRCRMCSLLQALVTAGAPPVVRRTSTLPAIID